MSDSTGRIKNRSRSFDDEVSMMLNNSEEAVKSRDPRSKYVSSPVDDAVFAGGDSGSTWQEKFTEAKNFKEDGNVFFKKCEYVAAMGKYHRALLYLKGIQENQKISFGHLMPTKPSTLPPEDKGKIDKLTADCYNNLAACLLAAEKPSYDRVLERSNQSLALVPNNAKAMYRKGVALFHIQKPDEALEVLKEASKLPDGSKDKNIQKYIKLCQDEQIKQDKTMKSTYKAMFSSDNDSEKVDRSS